MPPSVGLFTQKFLGLSKLLFSMVYAVDGIPRQGLPRVKERNHLTTKDLFSVENMWISIGFHQS